MVNQADSQKSDGDTNRQSVKQTDNHIVKQVDGQTRRPSRTQADRKASTWLEVKQVDSRQSDKHTVK